MRQPPAIANWLLERFGSVEDALVGDIYQEWSAGRSSAWFWHQTLSAIACGSLREIRRQPWRACAALLLGWSFTAAIFFFGDRIADGLAGLVWGWNRQDAYANHHWGPFYVGAALVAFGGPALSAWLVARLHRRSPAMLLGYVAVTFALLLTIGIVLDVLVRRGEPIPMWHPLFYAAFTTLPFFWHSGVVLVPLVMLLCGATTMRAQRDGAERSGAAASE